MGRTNMDAVIIMFGNRKFALGTLEKME